MEKLNKQEKAYAISRIREEIDKIVMERCPRVEYKPTDSFIREAASKGKLKPKLPEEFNEAIEKAIGVLPWSRNLVNIEDIIQLPAEARAEKKREASDINKRNNLFSKLTEKAQPMIDEINLGQADASRLSEVVELLRK